LHQREGEEGDEGGPAHHVEQANESDQAADVDNTLSVKPGGVEETQTEREAINQQGEVTRLDECLLDEQAAKEAGIARETAALEVFAGAGFDDFDAGDGFFSGGVHPAELVALAVS